MVLHTAKEVPEVGEKLVEEAAVSNAEKIKLAAMKLFGIYGYGSTTVRMIAKEAGLSAGQIAAHFGSKEELYQSIVKDAIEISNHAVMPVKEKMEELIREDALTKEAAWQLMEKQVLELIDYCLAPDNRSRIVMLNIALPESPIVDKACSSFQHTILEQQEMLLARLIDAYTGKRGILRARVISRAINGAIVSFAEHQEFLMNDVYANKDKEQAYRYAKGHLKNWIINSLKHLDEMEDLMKVEKQTT